MIRQKVEAEIELKERKKSVLIHIAGVAYGYGLSLAIQDRKIADEIVAEHKNMDSFVKHNNINARDFCIYKSIGHFMSSDAKVILTADDFDAATIYLEDAKYLNMAEKVEEILMTSFVPSEGYVQRFWKCAYCGQVNDMSIETDKPNNCSYCGAPRK